MFMRRHSAGPLGLLVVIASLPAAAEGLDEVVVTANRVAQSLDSTLAATTVLTREQIAARQARSLEDLLQGVEGLSIANSGGPGKLTYFFARGAYADQLLVMVEGVRIGSATAGTAALQNLPVELIERIEYVRGPRSSLYGSEAIGGVLQIFTRNGGAARPDFSASGGSFGTRQLHGAMGVGDEQAWAQAQLAWQQTDGIDACRGSSLLYAGCFAEEPDKDGYRYRSVTFRAGGEPVDGTDVEISLLRAASRVEYDGPVDEYYVSPNRSNILQQVLGVGATQDLGSWGSLAVHAGRAWDRSRDFREADFTGAIETRRDSANLQWNRDVAPGQLVAVGFDFQGDHVLGDTAYEVDKRDNVGLYAQYVGQFGSWRTELAVRGDDNEQFGRHGTGSAGLSVRLHPGLELIAQLGTAFKAPSFNDLYWPGFGNPNLAPEKSRSMELAARGHVEAGRWRLSLFESRIRDLIGYDMNYLPANIDAARIRGAELTAGTSWFDWNLDAGFTLQQAENRSNDANQGLKLARRPRVSGHLDVSRQLGVLLIGARLVAEGERFDDPANSRRVGGFGVLDLRAEAVVANDWRLQLRVANALDKHYETVAFYNQPGRAVYMTLRYAGRGR